MRNIIDCPVCGGRMESTYDMTDTYICDTCDYVIGEGITSENCEKIIP